MDKTALLASYDHHQRRAIEYPGVRKEVLPHLVRFIRPAPGANWIAYSRLNADNAEVEVAAQVADLTARRQPFSWKVFDHDPFPELGQHLQAHGLKPDDEPSALMVLDLDHAPAEMLAPVPAQVRLLTQPEELKHVIQIEEQVWGGSFAWMTGRLGAHMEIPGYLRVYVAEADGHPACAGWVYFTADSPFAELYGGSTVAQYRRRGLYSAVLAARVQAARARGCRYLTINASPTSRPIAAKHGFEFLTFGHDYDWDLPTE
jgi:hypothetical protein